MKRSLKIAVTSLFFILLLVALLNISPAGLTRLSGGLLWSGANALAETPQQGPGEDKLILGGSYTLENGEVLDGNLFVLGGIAEIAEGATVKGDAMILGGTLNIDGSIGGDVNAVGGLVTLGSASRIGGDVNTVSAQLDRAEGAQIAGKINNLTTGPYSVIIPGTLQLPNLEGLPSINIPQSASSPMANLHLNPLWDAFWWLIRSFIWAAVAVLAALFVTRPIDRTGMAAVQNPGVAGGLGCMTAIVGPLLLLLLAITICGLPISLIGALLLWAAWVFGVIVLGTETGKRLAGILKADWALPVSAGAGTFVLTLVSNGIGMLVPCVGWIVPAAIGALGLGAVLLTRFGSQDYPPSEDDRAIPGAEYIPPPAPGGPELPDQM